MSSRAAASCGELAAWEQNMGVVLPYIADVSAAQAAGIC